MSAGVYNFIIEEGATFEKTFTWTEANANSSPIPIVDSTIELEVKNKSNIDVYSTTSGHITIDPANNGKFTIKLPLEEVNMLTFDKARYELFITLPNGGNTKNLLEGVITFKRKFR